MPISQIATCGTDRLPLRQASEKCGLVKTRASLMSVVAFDLISRVLMASKSVDVHWVYLHHKYDLYRFVTFHIIPQWFMNALARSWMPGQEVHAGLAIREDIMKWPWKWEAAPSMSEGNLVRVFSKIGLTGFLRIFRNSKPKPLKPNKLRADLGAQTALHAFLLPMHCAGMRERCPEMPCFLLLHIAARDTVHLSHVCHGYSSIPHVKVSLESLGWHHAIGLDVTPSVDAFSAHPVPFFQDIDLINPWPVFEASSMAYCLSIWTATGSLGS